MMWFRWWQPQLLKAYTDLDNWPSVEKIEEYRIRCAKYKRYSTWLISSNKSNTMSFYSSECEKMQIEVRMDLSLINNRWLTKISCDVSLHTWALSGVTKKRLVLQNHYREGCLIPYNLWGGLSMRLSKVRGPHLRNATAWVPTVY